MAAPNAGKKRTREDGALKMLAARLENCDADALASALAAVVPGGVEGVLACLHKPKADAAITALASAARAVEKAAKCKFSSGNHFSYKRARSAVSAFLKLLREQAAVVNKTKDAVGIAAWCTGAVAVFDDLHTFDMGVSDYDDKARAIAGKSAKAAHKAAWAKASPAHVRQALEDIAKLAPPVKPRGAGAGTGAGAGAGSDEEGEEDELYDDGDF
jgi:hypothetical protein